MKFLKNIKKIHIIIFILIITLIALSKYFSADKNPQPQTNTNTGQDMTIDDPQATMDPNNIGQTETVTENTQTTNEPTLIPKRPYLAPYYTSPKQDSLTSVDVSRQEIQKLANSLPISVAEFQTSAGITTTINIFTLSLDEDYQIHIEIYGLDYQDQSTDPNANPEVTAFIESFNEVKRLLLEKGVDIKDIFFIFGGRQHIQETAQVWIDYYNLL